MRKRSIRDPSTPKKPPVREPPWPPKKAPTPIGDPPKKRRITDRITEQELRRVVQNGESTDLQHRRAIICFSLIGMASMAVVTLFQTRILRHLPDPPHRRFHSNRSISQYGVPYDPNTWPLM